MMIVVYFKGDWWGSYLPYEDTLNVYISCGGTGMIRVTAVCAMLFVISMSRISLDD